MIDKQFEKEEFKKSVKENVKFLYRKTLEEATQEQIFQAVSYTVKDVIIDNWLKSQKAYEKQDPKIVYYMSMEFLMGRALGNNLINLGAYGEVKEALEELGLDINCIEDQEPDPALGNGGLGRLAACFLDSLATLNYCAYGCGIRYRYGMFKQEIRDGYQVEAPDNWLKNGSRKKISTDNSNKINLLKNQLSEIKQSQEKIVNMLLDDSFKSDMKSLLNEKAKKLSEESKAITEKIEDLESEENEIISVINLSQKWKNANTDERKAVCNVLIHKIFICEDGTCEVVWNI